jgi:hypothetical protein
LNRNIEWWWPNFFGSPNLVFATGTLAFMGYLVFAWDLAYPKTSDPASNRTEKVD